MTKHLHVPTSDGDEALAIRHLAQAERLADQVPGISDTTPRPVSRVAVIGAGTMGSGIAVALADAGIAVNVVEQHSDAAEAGFKRMTDLYHGRVSRGRLSEAEVTERLGRIGMGDTWTVVSAADLIIEAAFEDLSVKKSIFARLDRLARPGAIMATNTSYLDVNAIAAVTARPADVLGLHFFSPAHVMRLVEVVQADATASDVLATGVAFARRIGKVPIVARVCDGFIGNRIFAVYRRHAEYLLEDGASPQDIDDALRSYGFAMGPFAVSDMSGLDIAWAMRKRRAATRDPGERYVAIPDQICEAGRLGRKTNGGWYDYDGSKAQPSAEVEAIIVRERQHRGVQLRTFSPGQIQRRLLAVIANEGARVLGEGVSLRPSDIDLAFVHGYGFPRMKGGPMFAADQRGLVNVLAEVDEAAQAGGVGSEPAPLLVQLVREGGSFSDWQRARSDRQG